MKAVLSVSVTPDSALGTKLSLGNFTRAHTQEPVFFFFTLEIC